MKSLVWQGPEEMTVEDAAEPGAEAGWVVLRVGSAGICGSEIEGYLGRMGNRTPPLIMGHEFAGEVVEAGSGVDSSWVGKKATVNPLLSCGVCRMCRAGMDNLCASRTMIGIHHPGGFAEYVAAPEYALTEVPGSLDISAAALAEPLANGVHVARLALSRGPVETAVVIGAGTIGLMCLQSVVLSGVPDVAVVEPYEARREHAKSFGASAVFASAEEARAHFEEKTDGFGVDVVVDAVGAGETRRKGAEIVKPGGSVVMIGLHEDETSVGFHDVIRGQVALKGSYAYTQDDFAQAAAWISSGEAGIGDMVKPLSLDDGPEAFANLVRGPSEQIKVFLAESEKN